MKSGVGLLPFSEHVFQTDLVAGEHAFSSLENAVRQSDSASDKQGVAAPGRPMSSVYSGAGVSMLKRTAALTISGWLWTEVLDRAGEWWQSLWPCVGAVP